MAGPVLYSTNPLFTEIVCDQYRGGRYELLWCCEVFDPGSHGAFICGADRSQLEPKAALL